MAGIDRPIGITFETDHWVGRFEAMGGPCEVLVEARDPGDARELIGIAAREAWRIERKFSRYRADGVLHAIRSARGAPIDVDPETGRLFDFADRAFGLSEGLFDVTSGILRAAWTFDGGDRIPAAEELAPLLPRIGWDRVRWRPPSLTVPEEMELDLGGIGKEYAVDSAAARMTAAGAPGVVVNFGGDLRVTGPREGGRAWRVGVETPGAPGEAAAALDVFRGGIATSGDDRRFVLKDGVRYGHVLNPKTGFPAPGAPRSVTVVADTCTEAGFLATLAMLKGADAEAFLADEGARFRCQR